MASNGTALPCQNGVNGVAEPLSRADEVDDVSDIPILMPYPSKLLIFYSY